MDRATCETGRAGFSLSGFASSILRLAYRAMKQRSERAALQAMPDHMLKDLGISRSQIEYCTSIRLAPSDTEGMDG